MLLALREGVRLLPGRSIGLWTWATSFGSINVSTCCWEEVPVAGLLGTVLLVGFLWLCQNSSIDPASGVSLRCSSSDPLVLLRFPRFSSINVSTCCLEDVPDVGLLGTLSLFGFLWFGHTSMQSGSGGCESLLQLP